MALNYDLFRVVVAPEFKEMSNAELDVFAEQAKCEVSESKFGKKYDRAVALITAHLIKLSERSKNGNSDGTGQIRKVKVGQLEREYDTGSDSASDDTYNLTQYGKEFIRIRRQTLRGPIFVSC